MSEDNKKKVIEWKGLVTSDNTHTHTHVNREIHKIKYKLLILLIVTNTGDMIKISTIN